MEKPLLTYLNDHLAGAKFATSLLKDFQAQEFNPSLSEFSGQLLKEIEADQAVLAACVSDLGGDSNVLKEAAAWVAQKAGRGKLSADDPLQLFESIEMLMLGVTGKLALWNALGTLSRPMPHLSPSQLSELRQRATDQRDRLERLRLELAKAAFEE